jgi:hypothetical protein
MINTRIMALVAILALTGGALPVVSSEVFAQENMTGNMTEGTTGNMTEGGNMTADSGNISGISLGPA